MKILHNTWTFILIILSIHLSAQNEWDIRFAQSSFDCSTNQVCYRLEVKNTSGADWTLGDQNYRLFYDGDLMTVTSVTSLLPVTHYSGVSIDMDSKYTGVGQDAASPLNDIDDHLGFLDFSIVQTDKSNPSAAVLLNATTYTPTAEICMDTDASVLSDPTGSVCLGFYHSRPSTAGSFTNQYTTISENNAPNNTTAATGINYDDLNASDGTDACPGSLCVSASEWDIQMTQSSVDCDANQVCYRLEVQNTSGTDWTLGDQNYRLFFDGDLMTVTSVTSLLPGAYYGNAGINMNSKYTGVGQDAASPLNDIDDHLGFLDFNIVQTDKSNPVAATQLTTGAFTPVAEICVDVDASVLSDATGSTCLAFYHSRPSTAGTFTNQYTTITENDAANSTTDSEGINYNDLTSADGSDACPGEVCNQSRWDIQMTQSSIDCEADQVCYRLEVKNQSGTDWTLGDQNYRLFFDGDLMTVTSVTSLLPAAYYGNAGINMNSKYTGVGQDSASPLDDIDDHLGFLDFNIVQTDKSDPASATQLTTGAFTPVAEICVDVDASVLDDATGSTCLAFYHSRPSTAGTFTNQYTTITENDAANSTTDAEGINYNDLTSADGSDACPGAACTESKEWNIQMTQSLIDCEADQICYRLEVQDNSGTDWTLGDQNYRLFFDGDLMTVTSVTSLLPGAYYGNAGINMNSKYTGLGQDSASPLDDIDDHLGFLDFSIVQTDKTNPPAAARVNNTSFTAVAEICVDVDASVLDDLTGGTCLAFYHSRPATAGLFTNQYTTITENDAANSTTTTAGINYDDLNSLDGNDACPGGSCAEAKEWDIRLTQTNLDCASDQACYRLEVQNTSGTDWTIGDQNYRLFFDGDLMTVTSVTSLLPGAFYSGAVIDQNSKYTGVGQDAASPLDDIDDHLGFLDFNIVQTDKSNPTGATILTTGSFTPVAEICVDLDAAVLTDQTGNTCIAFYHSRPTTAGLFTNQYTTISENDAPNSTADACGINYDDLTSADGNAACPGPECGPCNITSSGSSNLECNDNGTPFDLSDDYISFDLNPVGTGLGTGYSVAVDNGAVITPTIGSYGEVTSFRLQDGSADGTGYTLTGTDNGDSNCTFEYKFNQSSCSPYDRWDIRLTQSNVNCPASQACYQLEVKNTDGTDWTLGDQNYRLFFDGDLMTVVSVTSLLPNAYYGPVVIDQNTKYSGLGQESASPLDNIDDNLGFLDFNIVQTDKSAPASAVQLTAATFTPVAEICVDLAPAVLSDITNNTCLSFYHSRPSTAGTFTNQYTTISENNLPNGTIEATGFNYDDLTSDDGAVACDFSVCHSVDIALDKQVDELNPNAGDTVTFFIIVENEGLEPGTGVEVTDRLPSGIDYVSDDSQGNYDEVSGVWMIGNMAAGQIDTLQIRGRVLITGDYTNVAEVTATNEQDADSDPNSDSNSDDNNDGIPDDDEDSVTLLPNTDFDLALSKSLAPGQPVIVHLGEDIEYSIKVFNEGDIPAKDVEVCDLIPAGMILSPNDNNNWTNIGASVQGDTAYHTINQTLMPGDSAEVRILLRLLYSLPNRSIVNVAEIVGDKDADGNGVIDIDSEPDNNNPTEDDIEEEEVQFLDIDPTGYIYCDKTGKVVTGGTVSITGPNGIPNSEVLIFEDGSSGFYAWYAVGLQGVYTMTYNHPDGITFSTIRLPQPGPLDPTGMPSPVVLGSDTMDMHLIDTTFANNPFYLTFDFEIGDPIILKNNIPVSCALIGSIVCLDDDGNEMDDGDEPPFANGKVLLYECGNTTTPLDSTLTDADGKYVFDGLPGGNYQLRFIPSAGYRYILSQSDTLVNGFTSCISINPGQCDSSKTVCFRVLEYDFGDLPDISAGEDEDDYQTLGANGGPAHMIIGGLMLGASVDGESDGQPSSNALGDDADEDTFSIPASADWKPGGVFRLPFSYVNTTGDTAFVKIWIDWDADGDFSEANEEIINWNDADNPFPNMFSTTIPPAAAQNKNLGVRLRISLRDNMTPYGYIDSGEVEDYIIRLNCPAPICIPVIVEKMNK